MVTKKKTTKKKIGKGKQNSYNLTINEGNKKKCKSHCNHIGHGSCIYGLGFIGASLYYISTASGFWVGCWGIIKAIVWPAFLVYELMKYFAL